MSKRASVIVLGYGEEPHLATCVAALTEQLTAADELVLIDNGIAPTTFEGLELLDLVHVVGNGVNRGFAGGCRLGAASSKGQVLIFVNSDAVVRKGTIDTLIRRAQDLDGIVGGCLRLADQPHLVNSVGNPLHYLGITWAGHCGEPASSHQQAGPIPVATGGLFALRREIWDRLDGFDETYFAYHEDTDLSLRCWLSGMRVEYEPQAVADHHYEFSRNPQKMFLVERNRWQTVLADYPPRLLWAVSPPLLLIEPALLMVGLRQGWGRQKLRAWWWILRRLPDLLARRRRVQASVAVPTSTISGLMTARIEPPMVEQPPGMTILNAGLSVYWSLVRRHL